MSISRLLYEETHTLGRVQNQSVKCTRSQFEIYVDKYGQITIRNIHETSRAVVNNQTLAFQKSIVMNDENVTLLFGNDSCKIILEKPKPHEYSDFILLDEPPRIYAKSCYEILKKVEHFDSNSNIEEFRQD